MIPRDEEDNGRREAVSVGGSAPTVRDVIQRGSEVPHADSTIDKNPYEKGCVCGEMETEFIEAADWPSIVWRKGHELEGWEDGKLEFEFGARPRYFASCIGDGSTSDGDGSSV